MQVSLALHNGFQWCIQRTNQNTFTDCAKTAACRPAKHHYDECVERVTAAAEAQPDHKGPKEDCVEECKCTLFLGFALFVRTVH